MIWACCLIFFRMAGEGISINGDGLLCHVGVRLQVGLTLTKVFILASCWCVSRAAGERDGFVSVSRVQKQTRAPGT